MEVKLPFDLNQISRDCYDLEINDSKARTNFVLGYLSKDVNNNKELIEFVYWLTHGFIGVNCDF